LDIEQDNINDVIINVIVNAIYREFKIKPRTMYLGVESLTIIFMGFINIRDDSIVFTHRQSTRSKIDKEWQLQRENRRSSTSSVVKRYIYKIANPNTINDLLDTLRLLKSNQGE